MAKTLKRTVSLLLILLMVATCVWSAFSVQAASDVLFKDDFSSSALSGWSANNVGTISGGKYTINGTGANAVASLGSKKGVAILAEVAIDRTNVGNNGVYYNGGTAGLVFHAAQDLSTGYTFGLGVTKTGTTYALVTLASGGSTKILYQRALQIAGVTGGKLKRNTAYALKVLMEGDTFACYINNELFYECDAPAVKEGYIGVSSWCAKGMFTDFAVREMGKKVLESIALANTPAEITPAGYFEFDILANYAGVYGTKRISSESAGVTVTGIDGKLGQKTLTVGYGGKTAQFTTNVVASTEGEVVYQEDFSGELKDWTLTKNTKYGENNLKAEGGRLVGNMPKQANGSYSLLANYKKVDAVADGYYAISADVAIVADSTSVDKERECLGVLRFVNAGGVWQFRAHSTGEVRLYDGATTLLASAECPDVALGKTINMKVELRGQAIACYVNNKEVLSAKIPTTEITPYLGVAVYNGSAYFDNFKVVKLEKKSKWAIRSMYVVDANGEKCTSYAGRIFDLSKFALQITYADGVNGAVVLTKDMVQGYDSANKNTQKVKIVYGNKSLNFSVTYKAYLYFNDFSKNINGLTVTGNSAGNKYMPVKHNKGRLEVSYEKPADGSTTRRTFVVAESLPYGNLSVSADVALTRGNLGKGQYAGIEVRGTEGTSFSYRLVNSNSGMDLQLFHNHKGAGNLLMRKWPAATLLATYENGEGVIGLDIIYNLKIEAIDNVLYCYFNNVLIDTVTDIEDTYTFAAGGAKIFSINSGAIFDNVYVYPLDDRKLTSANVTGSWVKDGVIQLYQGMDIEPDAVSLELVYSDGFTIQQPLWADYITETYNPDILGEQTITISYQGVSKKVRVNVSARPDYIAAFAGKVKAFKKGSLTKADLPALNEMVDYFNTLTPYEINHMDQEIYKLYVDLVTEMDHVEEPELLKDAELIYYNDFTQQEDFSIKWSSESKSGDVVLRNGYFANEMKKYGAVTTTQMYALDSFGELKMVEADMMIPYEGVIAALMIYGVDKNYYHLRVNNKLVDTNGMPIVGLQFYKYTGGGHRNMMQTYPVTKGVDIKVGEWFNIRAVINKGIVSVYLNDVLMLQLDDSQTTDYIVDGFAGLRLSENDVAVDNIKVYGTKKEIPKDDYVKQITPTEYKDDFEDETVGKNPSHWVEDNYTDDWKVVNKGGNKVYGTTKKADTWSWLHAFEKDPVYKAKIMTTTGTGQAGLLARVTDKVSYLELGYDFTQKKWYIESDGGEDVETQTYYAAQTSPFALGEWHDIEVNLQDAKVTIMCDGAEVLTYDGVRYATIGRMGAYANNSDLYIDDVYVKSVLGTNFNDGVVEYIMQKDIRLGTLEVEDLSEDHLLAFQSGWLYESTDGGQTFEIPGPDSPYYAHEFSGGYPSYFDLGNDRWMRVVDGYAVQISTDDMLSWGPIIEIFPFEERFDPITGKEKSLVHTSTITKAVLADGTVRIFCPIAFRNIDARGSVLGHYTRFFYTDDGGETWNEAENDTRDFAPIYNDSATTTWSEGKVVQCADGTLRYYQTRNSVGSLIYMESADNGKTWGNFGTIPYMQAPKGSFNVEEDPYNPGTYYMAWVNCYPNSLGTILPRTRLSLARTTDGKNWEFLTDVDRTSDFHTDAYANIRQIVDPGVCVTEKYVHVTFCRASKYAPQSHNYVLPRYCRLEKDKLTARPWDDAVIYDSTQAASIQVAGTPQTKFGYADLFNTSGLQIEVTAINGNKTVEAAKEYDIVVEPNMFKLGKQTITLMSKNYLFTSYEIEVVPNYDLIWTIKGKGTVDPDPDAKLRMMEGETQTFTLKPAKGYKVSYVKVSGEKAKIKKNTFTISNVQENQEITVSFVKLSIIDYLPWIILGVVVVAGIGVGCVLLIPRLKKKKATEGMEDISSNSETPSDEN